MARKFDVLKLIRDHDGGRHRHFAGDGVCLTLQGNSAIWERQWRDPVTKKIRTASLGPAKGPDLLTLRQARDKAGDHRAEKRNRNPPSGQRINAGKTFGEVAEDFILFKSNLSNGAWRGGEKGDEAGAYRRTLKALWSSPVATLDTAAIGDVLEKMKPVTAKKTRVRIKAVFDWAKAKGYRAGDNPAEKKNLTPRMPSVPKAKHFPALPLADLPALMKELAAIDSPTSRALQWTLLTAARTSTTLGATWKEIVPAGTVVPTADGSTTEALAGDTWIIPKERMKEEDNDGEQRVPLIPEMRALLDTEPGDPNDLLFGAMHDRAMLWLLRSLRPGKATVHGTTRSCLTDWVVMQGFVNGDNLRKAALAHALGDDATDQAYLRTKLCEERRPMMTAYAKFCYA